ncbi:MAG: penicillin-binding protein 2 [Bdellovibrionota bacterium]
MIGQKDSLRYLQERFFLLFTVVTLVFGILLSRITYLQLINGKKYRLISDRNSLKEEILPGARGQILDRNGRLMVDNRLELDLVLNRQRTKDPEATIKQIAEMTGLPLKSLLRTYTKEVRQKQQFATVSLMRDLPRDIAVRIEANKALLDGVDVEARIKRVYLMNENASHVFGYTGTASRKDLEKEKFPGVMFNSHDIVGKYGLERFLDSKIRGRDGVRYVVVDAFGRRLKKDDEEKVLGNLAKEVEPKSGPEVILTLDADLQEVAQLYMKDMMGAVVATNPKTGEILAMHSQPGFDPTALSLNSNEEWERVVKNQEFGALRNKVIQDHFSPGSTFKVFTALTALEAGITDPKRQIFCDGTHRIGNRVLHCHKRNGHGWVNLRSAIQKSCNVYFYTLAEEMPSVDLIHDFAQHFGFGQVAGLGMERESKGILPSTDWKLKHIKQKWTQGETLMVAIGQSYTLTTPLQLNMAYSTLLNGGKLMKPYLLSSIRSHDGTIIEKNGPTEMDHVNINPNHLRMVKDGLSDVVNEPGGTGYRTVRSPLVKIGGKSGTVTVASFSEEDLFKSCENRPIKKRSHAWFVGYAPEEDPEIVVTVFAMHECAGSGKAGPVVKAIIEKWYEKNKAKFVPVSENNQARPDLTFSTR